MVAGGEKNNPDRCAGRGPTVRAAWRIVCSIGVLGALLGCASQQTRTASTTTDGSSTVFVSGNAEAHLPADAASALNEDDAFLLTATAPAPIWSRLPKGFQLSGIAHPRIEREIQRLRRSPQSVHTLMARSEPYLHFILDRIEAAGLPTELALLPAIESGFRPYAYSPDGAAGLWQFMPATGRMMGLRQNWWHDKRRTVRASTDAAIDFLGRLNARFAGDWPHTLAAYNAGATKVARAIRRAERRGTTTDFWSLDLPGETDRYVPRLLALARLIANPQDHGIELPPIEDRPYFAIATLPGQIDLTVAAGIAGMPVEDLLNLNAGHRRWAMAPDGPHELLLPAEKVVKFEAAASALSPEKRLRWQRHRIKPGESLNRIARAYSVPADAIRKANKLANARVRAGEELLIPLSDSVTFAQDDYLSRQRMRYRVRRGDSLYKIARRFQVSIKDLKRWNRVGRYIRPGERLTVFIDPDA